MTGENVDSVAEPIMVVTVITDSEQSVYYQVTHQYLNFMIYSSSVQTRNIGITGFKSLHENEKKSPETKWYPHVAIKPLGI